MVSFQRRDSKPREDYYYSNFDDAAYHFGLFQSDDSDLYSEIDLIANDGETVLRRKEY